MNNLKKMLALALALICLLSLAACKEEESTTAPKDTDTESTTAPNTDETTGPVEDETTGPADPSTDYVKLELVSGDVTLNYSNRTVNLYKGSLDASEITWSIEDPTIATVSNGVVTALKDGKTNVTATYGDQSATCIIRVSGLDEHEQSEYALWGGWGFTGDVSLKLGEDESFTLSLRNKETKEDVKDLQWHYSSDFANCCTMTTTENGVKITATAVTTNLTSGYVKVWTEYEGVTYECLVRVTAGTQTDTQG